MKRRVDQLLVERGLVPSREKAQALVLAGAVLAAGRKVAKPGQTVDGNAPLEVLAGPRYVSRGGFKLEAALDAFAVDVAGRVCADIGASTGGFTDCLLQRGAARVYAVDVGSGQLDWKLRNDPRVVVLEGVNARYLEPSRLGEPVDLAVCDVSFISAEKVLPALVALLKPGGRLLVLVKPQFEVGRGQVGKGGIVRHPALHAAAVARIEAAVRGAGFETAVMESPLKGAEGNKEFLLYGWR